MMAYLMRKHQAPLREVFQFMLIRTAGDILPNAAFLAQLVDYEVEILGSSSMEGDVTTPLDNPPVLTAYNLGLFPGSQGALDDEEGFNQVCMKLKALILGKKWNEIDKLREEFRDEDFGVFPDWHVVLRRAIYQATAMQINFVVEKVPTPSHPTTLLIHTYIEQTVSSINSSIGSTPETGYLDSFFHAVSYSLGVENAGVGGIFVDHLSQKLGAAYRLVHAGKLSKTAATTSKDSFTNDKAPLELEFDNLRTQATIVFGLFRFLSADSALSTYLEQYENSLATRLSVFLPVESAPTHVLLSLEDEIASMIPHPLHEMKVKRMLADIIKVPELNANWEAAVRSQSDSTMPKLEVALLDASIWPTQSLSKALGPPASHSHDSCRHPHHHNHSHAEASSSEHDHHHHGAHDGEHHHHHHHHHDSSIPEPIVLPEAVYGAWDSFKSFVQKEDESNKLVLLPHLGDAQITCEFGGKQYTLDVTTPMMLVLCGFNEVGEGPVSFQELQRQSNLPPKLLTQTLYSLSQPSTQLILRKTENPEDPLIKETDTFELNEGFTSKLRRVKVPNLKYPPKEM